MTGRLGRKARKVSKEIQEHRGFRETKVLKAYRGQLGKRVHKEMLDQPVPKACKVRRVWGKPEIPALRVFKARKVTKVVRDPKA